MKTFFSEIVVVIGSLSMIAVALFYNSNTENKQTKWYDIICTKPFVKIEGSFRAIEDRELFYEIIQLTNQNCSIKLSKNQNK